MTARLFGMASAIVLAAAEPARAESVADFYKGKQVRIIVGSAVGGGYDLYARALARQFGQPHPRQSHDHRAEPAGRRRHGDGQPALQPGAPGRHRDRRAAQRHPHRAHARRPGAKFDSAKLQWIGSLNREAYVGFIWHTAPVSNIAELATKEVLVGATTAGATMVDYPLLLNDLLGYKFKVVRGYQGPPQINLAMERGEVQGNGGLGYAVVKTLTQKWLEEKKIKILVQYNFQRLPELAGVPLVTELARTDSERQAMRLVFARAEYARPFFLPPDVPADRVNALRRAFDATMKDPAFLAEAEKLQLELSPMTGEEMQGLVVDLAKTPPDVVARVKAALNAGGKVAPTGTTQGRRPMRRLVSSPSPGDPWSWNR